MKKKLFIFLSLMALVACSSAPKLKQVSRWDDEQAINSQEFINEMSKKNK